MSGDGWWWERRPDDNERAEERLAAVRALCSGRPGYHVLTVKQVLRALTLDDDEPDPPESPHAPC